MANDTPTTEAPTLTVSDFVKRWEERVGERPYEVFVAMRQYENFEEIFGLNHEELANALMGDEALRNYLGPALHKLREETRVPTIEVTKTTPEQVAKIAESNKKAYEKLTSSKATNPKIIRGTLSDYSREYTQYWVGTLRQQRITGEGSTLEKEIEQFVKNEITRPGNLSAKVQGYVASRTHKPITVPPEVNYYLDQPKLKEAIWKAGAVRAYEETLSRYPTAIVAEELAQKLADRLEHPNVAQNPAAVVSGDFNTAWSKEVFAVKLDTESGKNLGDMFFQSYLTHAPLVIGKTLDGIFSRMPNTRDLLIQKVLIKTVDKIDTSTLKTGEFVADAIRPIIRSAGLAGEQTKGATSILSGVTNIISDTVVAFRTDEKTVAFLTAMHEHPGKSINTYTQIFSLYAQYLTHPDQVQMTHKNGAWIVQSFAISAAERILREGVKKEGAAILTKLGLEGVMGKLIGTLVGGASGPPGWIITGLSWFGGWLFGAAKRTQDGQEVPGLTFITIVAAAVILVPIVASFTQITNYQITQTSMLSVGGGTAGGTRFEGPLEPSDITGCPVAGNPRITYCPFSLVDPGAGIPSTHRDADAYDIGVVYGTPVRATHNGTVHFAGKNDGYWYMVQLAGITPGGQGYQTWYAHLSVLLVHKGQQVRVGEVIGRSGSLGISTGAHLHYEYRDGSGGVPPRPGVHFLPASCGYSNPLQCRL